MFKIIKEYKNFNHLTSFNSIHILQRSYRLLNYKYLLSNNYIQCFIVDTNHKNGLEIHCINEYGLIYIYNKTSLKLITIIHPRPSQIKRYYRALGLTVSKDIKKVIKACFERNTDHLLNEK